MHCTQQCRSRILPVGGSDLIRWWVPPPLTFTSILKTKTFCFHSHLMARLPFVPASRRTRVRFLVWEVFCVFVFVRATFYSITMYSPSSLFHTPTWPLGPHHRRPTLFELQTTSGRCLGALYQARKRNRFFYHNILVSTLTLPFHKHTCTSTHVHAHTHLHTADTHPHPPLDRW
jgi:hypothetical protein